MIRGQLHVPESQSSHDFTSGLFIFNTSLNFPHKFCGLRYIELNQEESYISIQWYRCGPPNSILSHNNIYSTSIFYGEKNISIIYNRGLKNILSRYAYNKKLDKQYIILTAFGSKHLDLTTKRIILLSHVPLPYPYLYHTNSLLSLYIMILCLICMLWPITHKFIANNIFIVGAPNKIIRKYK